MSCEPAITVSHVSKVFRLGRTGRTQSLAAIIRERARHPIAGRGVTRERFRALDDVSFRAAEGEVLGVIGRNGAGKSTLLKILSRITYPTDGYAELVGRVGSLLEVGTGFHPELTGIENVYLNGTILGMTKKEIDGRVDEIVAFAEVDKFLETPVKRYSSGMRVRLAFAVAAHLEPEILIIDEVLSVGDAAFQTKCLDKMRSLSSKDGRTVMYVSHNLVTVEHLCPRALLLVDGRLIFDGPTQETLAMYRETFPRAERGDVAGVFDLAAADRAGMGYDKVFKRLQLRPARGTPSNNVRMGDPLRIVIEVEGLDAIPDAVVMVTMGSSRNESLVRMTSRMLPLQASEARCREEMIVLDIPALPLTPGQYHVNVRVGIDPRIGQGVVDEVQHAGQFSVMPADVFGNGYRFGASDGEFTIAWDWELRPARACDAATGSASARASS